MILRNGGFFLVEGHTDKLFVERVFVPEILVRRPGIYVKVVEHAGRPSKTIRGIVGTATRMGVHYVFVSDLDRFACYGLRRDQRKREYPCLDESQIVVVNREIESWYLAGLDEATCGQLGVPFLQQTDGFTKERFTDLRPHRFRNNLDFMLEILDHYNLSHALSGNRSESLAYFCARHCDLSSPGGNPLEGRRAS